jgi:nucleotide-binding universal stress UspA family protein
MEAEQKKIARKQFKNMIEGNIVKPKPAKVKKFLAVFDGLKFSHSTLDYALQLAKETDSFLVGVFLDEYFYRSYNMNKILNSNKNAEELLAKLDAKDQEDRDKSVKEFEKACSKAGVDYSFHRNTGIAIQELKQESIFADLIIINDGETFNRFSVNPPTRFIKELLADVQCPVLIVPEKFKAIDSVTLLYDGGPSAVFAIKMYSYLFEKSPEIPVTVFTVKESEKGTHLPANKLIREFIKRHFPKANYVVEKGNPEEEVLGHLRYHKANNLVVLGAYRRSEISRWFKTSMADILMKQLDTPLFIAHNK